MMAVCVSFDPAGPFLRTIVDFMDCHALALGEGGYRALGLGSPWGGALTGLLTVAVALVGYRMVLGQGVALRDGVNLALRVGIVLALATQWSAYRPLVFDFFATGPNEIASTLVGGPAWASSGGDLIDRTQAVSDAMVSIAAMPQPASAGAPSSGEERDGGAGPATAATGGLTTEQQGQLASAARIIAIVALGAIVPVHVIAGLFLSLGPLFIACLLFDTLHGLLAGWVRILAGTALVAIAAPILLALQLAVVEPQTMALAQQVRALRPDALLPGEIEMTARLFAVSMLAAGAAGLIAASGFCLRFARFRAAPHDRASEGLGETPASVSRAAFPREIDRRSRAQGIADAVATLDRRQERLYSNQSRQTRSFTLSSVASGGPDRPGGGESRAADTPRRTTRRQSAGGNRRDRI